MRWGRRWWRQVDLLDQRKAKLQINDISVLIGEKGLEDSLKCLESLVWSINPKQIHMHLDGDVSDSFFVEVKRKIKSDIVLVSRKSSDEVMGDVLRKYPSCWKFRQSNVMGLKLLDVMLFKKERKKLLYFDTDIFFFNKVDLGNVDAWPGPVFMEDLLNSYSIRPWGLYPLGDFKLCEKICAGFTKYDYSDYDLDFVEWFLDKCTSSNCGKKRPYFVEQTCWAALAARANTPAVVGAPNFTFPIKGYKRADLSGCDAVHYVSTFRGLLKHVGKDRQECAARSIFKVKPARVMGPMGIVGSDIKRKIMVKFCKF